jgi:hypothetical protein
VLVTVVGAVVLVGWAVDSTALKSLSPNLSQMKANTALCFVLSGLSLALLLRPLGRSGLLGRLLAGLVATVALLTLSEYIFGWNLGIDQVLFDDPATAAGTPAPGRMGANTAINFALAGLSLLLLDAQWRKIRPAQIGSLVIGALALIAVLGYAYGVSNLSTSFITRNVTPMALHTALTFIVLAAGLMLARPNRGMMVLATDPGPGGQLVRRLLLPTILLPPLTGYARLKGQDAGWYGLGEGLAIYATSLVVMFGALVWATARSLARSDVARSESEAREKAILDSALDPIVTVDQEGRILDFNPAAEEAFGYRKEDATGEQMAELIVPPSLRTQHREAFAHHLTTGESKVLGQRLELTAMRSDGSEFPVELSITRMDLSDRPFFTGYLRDISQRKASEEERTSLEAELRQAQKMEAIGRLAGGIAHDFNNLLTVIGGYSDLQLKELPEGNAMREDAEQIKVAAERAAALTRQLLVFSRHQVLDLRVLDLNESVAEIEPMLGRVIGEDIELATRLDPDLVRIRADPNQIHQVILNLAVNARDAMPAGGRLTLETSNVELDRAYVERRAGASLEPGAYAMLAISDTGVGIDAETQAKIFDPFFTTKGLDEGTGLGLSTVYGIARQSGGAVWVYSEPGHGATFKVYLPRVDATSDDADKVSDIAPEADAESPTETVLVVEDEQAVRVLTRRILAAAGYTVLEAADGGEAIEICEHHDGEIQMVVTDMVMPGISGLELGEELLARRPDLKLLIMSGYTERAIDEHALGASVAFLQKPFSSSGLTSKVRETLAESR